LRFLFSAELAEREDVMYLGLDLGTSGVKALLIDGDQQPVASGHGPLDVSRPHPGWSEQDPAHWLEACEHAIGELKASHPNELAAVRGIGLSGQMHGATLLDRDDHVLRPCILWNDTRSHAEAAMLDADPRFRELTGNIVFPGFTGHLRPRGESAAAEGLSAPVAFRRAHFRNVGFGRHLVAGCRQAALGR
jgi:sugar (pentulose or hexulose) kinase